MFIKSALALAVLSLSVGFSAVSAAETLKRTGDRPAACDSTDEYVNFATRSAAIAAAANGKSHLVIQDAYAFPGTYAEGGGWGVTFEVYGPGEAPPRANDVQTILNWPNCG